MTRTVVWGIRQRHGEGVTMDVGVIDRFGCPETERPGAVGRERTSALMMVAAREARDRMVDAWGGCCGANGFSGVVSDGGLAGGQGSRLWQVGKVKAW
ncbi:putative leucine-rich repeat extensin-like protein 2 [Iris pallida]|uniref:Leucine-rich repeat extensin-like protein 2 n=1 Tax=Iris pallida TaxID=29817 RepID=A0AAX6G4I3_IRIPA|nr:putative leucine-rich repeat extensin-like protein 2 [Iris pallida]KAJ6823333.1 putative leucine-rich repeat extensin-like protein 2 [Iris pallida]